MEFSLQGEAVHEPSTSAPKWKERKNAFLTAGAWTQGRVSQETGTYLDSGARQVPDHHWLVAEPRLWRSLPDARHP